MLLFIEKKKYIMKIWWENVLKLDNYIALEKPTCWQIKHTVQVAKILIISFHFRLNLSLFTLKSITSVISIKLYAIDWNIFW